MPLAKVLKRANDWAQLKEINNRLGAKNQGLYSRAKVMEFQLAALGHQPLFTNPDFLDELSARGDSIDQKFVDEFMKRQLDENNSVNDEDQSSNLDAQISPHGGENQDSSETSENENADTASSESSVEENTSNESDLSYETESDDDEVVCAYDSNPSRGQILKNGSSEAKRPNRQYSLKAKRNLPLSEHLRAVREMLNPEVNDEGRYVCTCEVSFSRRTDLTRHVRNVHQQVILKQEGE